MLPSFSGKGKTYLSVQPGSRERDVSVKNYLRVASMEALEHVYVSSATNGSADERERQLLQDTRDLGLYEPLAARLALLTTLGWKRSELAEALDVSRVTVNKWLKERTTGLTTFDPYLAPDAMHRERVFAPVVSKLSASASRAAFGIEFRPDKFTVPEGFSGPLKSLWRVAYRARGPKSTADPAILAAGDALDITISLLLRRGVTNLAISRAADVTHRAVLDRMNRARARGILLECYDDSCEGFVGERQLLGVDPPKRDEWLSAEDIFYAKDFDDDRSVEYSLVRLSRPRPDGYWIQTLRTGVDEELLRVKVLDGEVADPATDLALKLVAFNGHPEPWGAVDEITHAARLGRLKKFAEFAPEWQALETIRSGIMAVPSPLLYVESAVNLPNTPDETIAHVPSGLWERKFDPHDLVVMCFRDPEAVAEEFPPISRHPADALTRRQEDD